MTTSALGIVLIMIVVAAGLVVWISTVIRADRHPETGRGGAPAQSTEGSSEVTRASRCRAATPRPSK